MENSSQPGIPPCSFGHYSGTTFNKKNLKRRIFSTLARRRYKSLIFYTCSIGMKENTSSLTESKRIRRRFPCMQVDFGQDPVSRETYVVLLLLADELSPQMIGMSRRFCRATVQNVTT
jgi:hypothetical protein